VAYVIKKLFKRGTKRLCKDLLKSHRDDAEDTGVAHEFERVLIDAGLPASLDEFPIDDEEDEIPTHGMPSQEVRREYDFFPAQTSYDDFGVGPSHLGPSQTWYGDYDFFTHETSYNEFGTDPSQTAADPSQTTADPSFTDMLFNTEVFLILRTLKNLV